MIFGLQRVVRIATIIDIPTPYSYNKHRGEFLVNSCELTASVTAIANTLACQLTEDELNLLGLTLTLLADTSLTIATQRNVCNRKSD